MHEGPPPLFYCENPWSAFIIKNTLYGSVFANATGQVIGAYILLPILSQIMYCGG